jgi:hypothetical protein
MNNDSPWAGRHDSPLDRAIDRAVREMMQVDPAPGLRRRVLASLQPVTAQRAPFALRFGWAAAMVAVVIAALIYTTNRSTRPAAVDPVSSQAASELRPAREAAAATAPPAPAPAAPPTAPRIRTPHGTREAIAMPRVGNVFGPPSRSAAAAAAADTGDITWATPSPVPPAERGDLAPLAISPLAAPPIETPPIVIAPLQTAAPKGGQ